MKFSPKAICLNVFFAALVGASSAGADPIDIVVNYNWATPASDAQKTTVINAMNSVVSYYRSLFAADYVGETWTMNFNWTNLTSASATNLGTASPDGFYLGADIKASYTNANVSTNLYYPIALADHLAGGNYSGTNTALTLNMNSSITDWDWSTTNKAPGTSSFFTTAVHEIGHGLGFLSSLNLTNGTYYDTNPSIFDTFLTLGKGTNDTNYLVNMTASNRLAASTSNLLYFNGSNAVAAQGDPIPIYSPVVNAGAIDGSALSHLDWSANTNESLIMMWSENTNVPESFSYSSTEIGIYQDLGYTVVPEPASCFLFGIGVLGLAALCRLRVSSSGETVRHRAG